MANIARKYKKEITAAFVLMTVNYDAGRRRRYFPN